MLVTYWIGLGTSTGAVSRIRSYVQPATIGDLDSEIEVIPEDWSQQGGIDITGLSASYEYALGDFFDFFGYMLSSFSIAHKLHEILDFDKFDFMENGKIVEFDTPKALLSKEGTVLGLG
ncbi:uncharacterized protein N7500_007563 [Penicillium coprophilum]|uniref:uncharacterized protein n=1 Tax=Penicillium coprophilum TaxID=36646 RepID=UPI0023875702|nr:uncharacterized protein N7500_005313 [Penicillium coprophilum]XP_056533707.1 uncharacterized protein N7500_007563 [Penicillium coprophilum]KAJ5163483.1 hypothetical protein N7500_005313 [Penicillium coprophilum]KAJ5165733.1 hypothetical protein N7500_007563 [Penicillium coprophilum]